MPGRRGHRDEHYDGIGLLVVVLLAIFAMPLVGGYVLVTGKDGTSKILGAALLLVGLIIWIAIGMS